MGFWSWVGTAVTAVATAAVALTPVGWVAGAALGAAALAGAAITTVDQLNEDTRRTNERYTKEKEARVEKLVKAKDPEAARDIKQMKELATKVENAQSRLEKNEVRAEDLASTVSLIQDGIEKLRVGISAWVSPKNPHRLNYKDEIGSLWDRIQIVGNKHERLICKNINAALSEVTATFKERGERLKSLRSTGFLPEKAQRLLARYEGNNLNEAERKQFAKLQGSIAEAKKHLADVVKHLKESKAQADESEKGLKGTPLPNLDRSVDAMKRAQDVAETSQVAAESVLHDVRLMLYNLPEDAPFSVLAEYATVLNQLTELHGRSRENIERVVNLDLVHHFRKNKRKYNKDDIGVVNHKAQELLKTARDHKKKYEDNKDRYLAAARHHAEYAHVYAQRAYILMNDPTGGSAWDESTWSITGTHAYLNVADAWGWIGEKTGLWRTTETHQIRREAAELADEAASNVQISAFAHERRFKNDLISTNKVLENQVKFTAKLNAEIAETEAIQLAIKEKEKVAAAEANKIKQAEALAAMAEKEAKRIADKLEQVEQEHEQTKKVADQLELGLETEKVKTRTLASKNELLESTVKDKEHETATLQSELASKNELLESTVKAKEHETAALKAELASKNKLLESTVKTVKGKEHETATLKAELASKNELLESTVKTVKAKEHETATLKAELASKNKLLESTVKDKEHETATLKAELASKNKLLESTVKDKEHETATLKAELASKNELLESTVKTVKDKKHETATLQSELASKNELLESMVKTVKDKKHETATLQSELASKSSAPPPTPPSRSSAPPSKSSAPPTGVGVGVMEGFGSATRSAREKQEQEAYDRAKLEQDLAQRERDISYLNASAYAAYERWKSYDDEKIKKEFKDYATEYFKVYKHDGSYRGSNSSSAEIDDRCAKDYGLYRIHNFLSANSFSFVPSSTDDPLLRLDSLFNSCLTALRKNRKITEELLSLAVNKKSATSHKFSYLSEQQQKLATSINGYLVHIRHTTKQLSQHPTEKAKVEEYVKWIESELQSINETAQQVHAQLNIFGISLAPIAITTFSKVGGSKQILEEDFVFPALFKGSQAPVDQDALIDSLYEAFRGDVNYFRRSDMEDPAEDRLILELKEAEAAKDGDKLQSLKADLVQRLKTLLTDEKNKVEKAKEAVGKHEYGSEYKGHKERVLAGLANQLTKIDEYLSHLDTDLSSLGLDGILDLRQRVKDVISRDNIYILMADLERYQFFALLKDKDRVAPISNLSKMFVKEAGDATSILPYDTGLHDDFGKDTLDDDVITRFKELSRYKGWIARSEDAPPEERFKRPQLKKPGSIFKGIEEEKRSRVAPNVVRDKNGVCRPATADEILKGVKAGGSLVHGLVRELLIPCMNTADPINGTIGKKRRIYKIVLRVINTTNLEVCIEGYPWVRVPGLDSNVPKTGEFEVAVEHNTMTSPMIGIRQVTTGTKAPFCLTSISAHMQIEE